ncbi:MAG TPA: DUF1634 domain-containing protein [Terriglobales bacterium]|nr:DUF1634 domain-containing protein [Terriglobales bacterium]
MVSRDGSEAGRRRGWTEADVDVVISRILRTGLTLSAALVAAGAAIFLARHGGETAAYRVFRGVPPDYREVGGVIRAAAGFRGRGLIMAGLILLVATPVARVAFSVLAFLRQRDYVFVAVTLAVLAILLFSVFWLGLR